jgi:8-amino-7-oxononanoate synthase
VSEAAATAAREFGAGAGSARLITGGRAVHRELEEDLAAAHGTEAALLFPTGYMANLAVATALAALGDPERRVRMYSDELNHASIIDGIRLGRAECVVYPHVNLPRVLDAGGEHAGPSESVGGGAHRCRVLDGRRPRPVGRAGAGVR